MSAEDIVNEPQAADEPEAQATTAQKSAEDRLIKPEAVSTVSDGSIAADTKMLSVPSPETPEAKTSTGSGAGMSALVTPNSINASDSDAINNNIEALASGHIHLHVNS